MSDLQISLSVVGALVIAGVYLFNVLQERKYRRKLEGAFETKQDALLMSKSPNERVEPVLQSETTSSSMFSQSTNFSNADPLNPTDEQIALDEEIQILSHELETTSELPGSVDLEIECVARIHASEPIPVQAITGINKIIDIGKPLQWFGFNTKINDWQPLTQSSLPCSEILIAMQLADRSGPAGEAQINSFFKIVEDLAIEHTAIADFPDRQAALKQAVVLDAFCADVDIQVGFHLIKQEGHFAGTRLRAMAEASGFKLGETGFLEYLNPRGEVLFTLGNSEPTPFTIENLRNLSTHGLTFLFDVPRVGDGLKTFDQLVVVAKRLELALGGLLVDDNRRPLSEESIAKIRSQLQTTYAKMDACEIRAGSPRALRLFS